MLTKVQVEILQGIIGVNKSPEIVTIKNRKGVPKNYAYGLISGSRLDLDSLKNRGLLSFRRGYCEPQVSSEGLSVLRKFQILSLLEDGLSQNLRFIDEEICEQIPEVDIKDIQNLLIDLQSNELIAGELRFSPQDQAVYRFADAWVTDWGHVALQTPDVFWNKLGKAQALKQPQGKRKTHPVEAQFSQAKNSERMRAVASAESAEGIPDSIPYMEAHIEALKALAQSIPDDRRSQVMAILNHLSQAVESPERQCA
ncbi:hypothetical protein C1752_06169 [Acaryochloris thomasi RCC1774]|uniref:Uncharacterized protein n=1 Tax=Acaryochloris thomasi RCC1774 TaxID=1764569 RepID=A0A2W1JC35_9CYAN|nr:hypothetical protein [Acaryochloris thomasi]PZD71549.1 hypothetical protein C1752_06169 [Acaryochloris thomasi RCC1774]